MEALIFLAIFSLFGSSALVAGQYQSCSGVPAGQIYLFPYPGDCAKYYECRDYVGTVHTCDGGLWFNEALQGCDHPDNSGCIPLVCPPGTVDFYAYPGDCTRYVECYQGKAETHSCPDDLYFNAREKRCVSAPQSGCGQYSTSIEPTWTTPTTTCYGVLPGTVILKPYPGECQWYIECYGAREIIYSCPPGLYFDYPRQMCLQPELTSCDETTATADPNWTTPLPNPDPDIIDDPRCADGNNQYWPDVECSRFIECYQGQGYILSCPSGLYFNPTDKNCEDPSISQCGANTNHVETTTRGGNWTPDIDCPWPSYDRYLFPFPGDCTRFLECYLGDKTVMDCPAGLWFNPTLLVCDYPYHSGCVYRAGRAVEESN